MAMHEVTRRGFILAAAGAASYGLLLGVQRACLPAMATGDDPASATGPVTIMTFGDDGTRIGPATLPKARQLDAEWKKQLSPGQYAVTRRGATEFAFSGDLYNQHAAGLYRCIDCANALFDSATKFDSGTGWPSFWGLIAAENAYEKSDTMFGVVRREVKCRLCDAHLGHVFTDGPEPTGLRYCMNSAALRFMPRNKSSASTETSAQRRFRAPHYCLTSASKSS